MSDAKLRVEIAKDVLAHIKAGNFTVETGSYFHSSVGRVSHILNRDGKGSKPLKELIEGTLDCQVCAKGGLMYAHIMRGGDAPVSRWALINSGQNYETILTYFPAKMLAEVETLFEGKVFQWNECHFSDEEAELLENYYSKQGYKNLMDEDRLVEIMKLLIKNKGEKLWLP